MEKTEQIELSADNEKNAEAITFEDLGLDEATLAAVKAKGFQTPSPIQALAIPRLLTGDANIIAKARTGTGKTAAFGLPLVQKIRTDEGYLRALILTPTRELALQVCREVESLSTGRYPRLTSVYGGQSMGEQLRELKRGTEIVVGTPGRVMDHLSRGSLVLDKIDYFILDEADEMLDMGFIEDIESIFSQANPNSRILLFSATMPPEILKIAAKFMGDYEIVEEEQRPEEPILTEQQYWVVRGNEKLEALVRMIDISPDFYGLVFTQTKVEADSVSRQLDERGYEVAALHGDIPQGQREKILARFRSKKTRILVATDVAARGIDVEGLSHVVNYDLPFDGPTYIHRIGRTGRAGAHGLAFTLVRPEERRRVEYLRSVARKATKSELKEAHIPTIEEVLAVKRSRLFDELKISLGIQSVDSNNDELLPENNGIKQADATEKTGSDVEKVEIAVEKAGGDIPDISINDIGLNASSETMGIKPESVVNTEPDLEDETLTEDIPSDLSSVMTIDSGLSMAHSETDAFSNNVDEFDILDKASQNDKTGSVAKMEPEKKQFASLPKVPKEFRKMADELCENYDSKEILASVLQKMYGKELDYKRYGNVTAFGVKNSNSKGGGDGSAQLRLFVQLGRRDGFNAREIASYFSNLMHIQPRLVDRIDVAENFTLVSLPIRAAKEILDMSRRDRSLPHMHVDEKEPGNVAALRDFMNGGSGDNTYSGKRGGRSGYGRGYGGERGDRGGRGRSSGGRGYSGRSGDSPRSYGKPSSGYSGKRSSANSAQQYRPDAGSRAGMYKKH